MKKERILNPGDKVGKLSLLKLYTNPEDNQRYFVCKCDCGNIIEKKQGAMLAAKRGNYLSSCGCGLSEVQTGKGKLQAGDKIKQITLISSENEIRISENNNKYNEIIWKCKCDCGKTFHRTNSSILNSIRRDSNISCKKCRLKNQEHGEGTRYGYLVLIKPVVIKLNKFGKKKTKWLCQCDCGKTCKRWKNALVGGITNKSVISCGCKNPSWQTGEDSCSWRGYKDICYSKWNSLIKSAEKRGIPFEITIEDVWEKYEKQKGKCAYTGCEISFNPIRKDMSSGTASVDRINSYKHYTKDNIQIVHKTVNKMKMAVSEKDFFKICRQVVDYRLK